MIGLAKKKNPIINVNGHEYQLNDDFRACLTTWHTFERAKDGDIKQLTAVIVAYKLMLGREIDFTTIDEAEISGVISGIFEYFSEHSKVGGKKDDDKAPMICFEQDETLIRDAFRLLGKDLYADDMDFPTFMATFRLLQTTEAPLCRVLYLRQLIRDQKIGRKEYKSEREEIRKIGEDVVILRKKLSKKEQEEMDNRRQSIRERFKNVTVVQN